MFRIILFHFKYGILYNFIAAVTSAIVFLLVGGLLGFIGMVFPCVVAHIVVAAEVILLSVLKIDKRCEYIEGYKDKEGNYKPEDNAYTKMWFGFCEKDKKITIIPLLCVLLLFLAIAAVFFYFGFRIYQGLPIYVSKSSTETGTDLLMHWILPVVLSSSAVTWLIFWLSLVAHYSQSACGCRVVMSRMQVSSKDSHFSEWTQEKTKDGYGTVGSVYVNNNKVGDIKGSTTYTVSRSGWTHSWTAICRCRYCGEEYEKKERRSKSSLWR